MVEGARKYIVLALLASTYLRARPAVQTMPRPFARPAALVFPRSADFKGPYGFNLREMPDAPLFLYLNEIEHAKTWIEGGYIPMKRASSYLSSERSGTRTPDEVRQHRWDGARPATFEGVIKIEGNVKDIRFTGTTVNGNHIPDTRIDDYEEDAFVLCLSHTRSDELAKRLGNKKCCIEIKDVSLLISALQTVGDARYGRVRYTKSEHRSHFMKSIDDAWQDEYRFVIPTDGDLDKIDICLKPGVGTTVIVH